MPVERRGWVTHGVCWVNGRPEEPSCFTGRRQPSLSGTSRMRRESHVRICERLGVKFPGPTRLQDAKRLPETFLEFVRGGALDRQAHPHAAGEGEELIGSQAFEEPSVAGEYDRAAAHAVFRQDDRRDRLYQGAARLSPQESDVSRDRHGNVRLYVRRKNVGKVRLRLPPGAPAFMDEYKAALERLSAGKKVPQTAHPRAGTLGWLVHEYERSFGFRKLTPREQRVRHLILEAAQYQAEDGGRVAPAARASGPISGVPLARFSSSPSA